MSHCLSSVMFDFARLFCHIVPSVFDMTWIVHARSSSLLAVVVAAATGAFVHVGQ